MEKFGNGDLLPKYDTCFFERYAKETLADLVSAHYAGLVNRDRPDLQDTSLGIGIEVTRAMREGKAEAHELINDVAGQRIIDVPSEVSSSVNAHGYGFVLNGQLIGRAEREYWERALPLQHIIDSKVAKVANGFYGYFSEFGLYVFSKETLSTQDVLSTMDWMISLQKPNRLAYNYLFLSQSTDLWVCNLDRRETHRFNIPVAKRQTYYNIAITSHENHSELQRQMERMRQAKGNDNE